MSDNTNAIQLKNEIINAVAQIINADAGATFCSVSNDGSRESQSKLYSAMNNPDHRISDFINKSFSVQDVLIEMREILNEETGVIVKVPRVVLIDEAGAGYQATSIGIFQSVCNAYRAFGPAPWNPPLECTIKQRPTKNGSMLTADFK